MGYDSLFKSIGHYIILPLLQEFVWNTDNYHAANLVLKMDQNIMQDAHYYHNYRSFFKANHE